jgi:hypothetical protein
VTILSSLAQDPATLGEICSEQISIPVLMLLYSLSDFEIHCQQKVFLVLAYNDGDSVKGEINRLKWLKWSMHLKSF